MNNLNIFVCECFSPEFIKVAENLGFDDVAIMPYPSTCQNKLKKAAISKVLQETIDNGDHGLIISSKNCDAIKLIPEGSSFEVKSFNNCFSLLANEKLINYMVDKGGYVIGLGWLNKWREHIKASGFDRITAIQFYKEFCKELIYFDTGIDSSAEKKLKELSSFLELPYIIIPYELEIIEIFIKSVVFEWRLHKNSKVYDKTIAEIQSRCAEYSAVFDLFGKIASFKNKRETIEKIKEVFLMILGARDFKYWNYDYNAENLTEEIKDLFSSDEKSYILNIEENRFCIKVQLNDKIYGAIDVGNFLFPRYIEKYLNFAIEIAKVSVLVLSNIEYYEMLLSSEKELQYLSFHDSLTGLYNRTYVNEILSDKKDEKYLAVFIFDIDKLKYVNDNFGHREGDKLICNVANILDSAFRETDTVARIGGDEFIAILPECDLEMAEMFKNRINEAIMIHNDNNPESHLNLSVSVGFAVSDGEEVTVNSLMHKADELMYADKMDKRN